MDKKRPTQPLGKMKVRTGDIVIVIAGKDKGQHGKVTTVNRVSRRITIEGVNMGTKHVKPIQSASMNRPGDRVQRAMPLHISNVMLADPKTGKPTRIGRKEIDGKMVRYAKDSGEQLES
jgi:large subunit ribosomal protein L24